MAKFKALILAGGAFFALARAAVAADLLPPAPALEPLPPAPVEFNGWYLRGDVGLGANAATADMATSPNPLLGTNPGNLPYSASASQTFNNTTISASGMFDFGVGYQFNQWLRGDVTLEYRGGGHFQSLYTLNDPTPPTTQYADFYRADTSSLVGLINAYVDMGTWYGVTPFVGAGVGFARNTLSGFTDQGFGYYQGNPLGAAGGYFSDGTSNNFAWALMTGLDFNVTPNLKLELGYRYLDYGKITTGSSHCLNGVGGFGCSGGAYTVYSTNTLASNDFRLGLRWMIGEAPAYPPEAPLVRKY
jgi:opacity protein-like surface antigen